MYELFQSDEKRYERKFAIEQFSKINLEFYIKDHLGAFSEIFYERRVNNIYFDTVMLDNYNDNEVGKSKRLKVRIRWYGDIFKEVKNPVLEIKIKDGWLGSKKNYKLDTLSISPKLKIEDIRAIIKASKNIPDIVKFELLRLDICLLNSYKRKYFISFDKKFRITIDSDMAFYNMHNCVNTFLFKQQLDDRIVLELKYDQQHDDSAMKITNGFPFRMTKSSKYVTGIDLTSI